MSDGGISERLARVLMYAEFVWDDEEQARTWMNKPHRELGGEVPMDLARTETGARQVEEALNKLFYRLPA